MLALLAEKLPFIDSGHGRQVEGHRATVPRVIEGRGDRERVAVAERRPIKHFIQSFEQVITGGVLHHQVAAGGDVDAVVGPVENPCRRLVAVVSRRFRGGRRRRLGRSLVEMHMDMDGGRCGRGGGRYRLVMPCRLRLLLRCGLVCSLADVAGERFQQEDHQSHDRAGCGEGQLCDGVEHEPHDIHL